MELKHDWKVFNAILFPQDHVTIGATGAHSELEQQSQHRKLVILEESQKVVDGIISTGAHFKDRGLEAGDMTKQRLDGLASRYEVDQTIILNRKDLDQCIVEAVELGHNYYQQLETIRTKALQMFSAGQCRKQSAFMVSRRHFVLDLFSGSFRRMLPRSFNLLIFIDTTQQGRAFQFKSLLISFNQGKVDQFFEPDFSSLHENRLELWSKYWQNIGEYLESRYMMPCYGLFLGQEQWERCLLADTPASSRSENPWRLFSKFCDEGTAAIFPRNYIVKSMLASQQLMVYFGRAYEGVRK